MSLPLPVADSPILGRLSLAALPLHEPILVVTFIGVALGGVAVLGLITWYRWWGILWRDWITSVDHKKIGIMYMVLGIIMLLRGFSDALMMRAQQAVAFGRSEEHTSELQSLMRISYAVFCLTKNTMKKHI